jgi:hypothetical protein
VRRVLRPERLLLPTIASGSHMSGGPVCRRLPSGGIDIYSAARSKHFRASTAILAGLLALLSGLGTGPLHEAHYGHWRSRGVAVLVPLLLTFA